MCQCDPSIRTPYCGKGDCVWPKSDKPQTAVEVMQQEQDQDPRNRNRKKIAKLSLENPYVNKAWTAYRMGHYSYEEALEVMVLALNETYENWKQLATDVAQQAPHIINVEKDDGTL